MHMKPTKVSNATGGRGNVGVTGVTSNFRLIQTVREECRVHLCTRSCSSNNSRVAEVHVCGSYARGHILFFTLTFSRLKDHVMLTLCLCSRERTGAQFDVCVEQCVGAVRTTSQSLERLLSSIGSSNMRYDLSVRLPSKYLFACFRPSWLLADRHEHLRPSRIPLSAFIVEDMTELARAHATYRFVVLDEEEERPRILVRAFHKLSTRPTI